MASERTNTFTVLSPRGTIVTLVSWLFGCLSIKVKLRQLFGAVLSRWSPGPSLTNLVSLWQMRSIYNFKSISCQFPLQPFEGKPSGKPSDGHGILSASLMPDFYLPQCWQSSHNWNILEKGVKQKSKKCVFTRQYVVVIKIRWWEKNFWNKKV